MELIYTMMVICRPELVSGADGMTCHCKAVGVVLVIHRDAFSTCRRVEVALEMLLVSNCFGRGSLGERTGSGKPKKGKSPGRGPFGGLCRVLGVFFSANPQRSGHNVAASKPQPLTTS